MNWRDRLQLVIDLQARLKGIDHALTGIKVDRTRAGSRLVALRDQYVDSPDASEQAAAIAEVKAYMHIVAETAHALADSVDGTLKWLDDKTNPN